MNLQNVKLYGKAISIDDNGLVNLIGDDVELHDCSLDIKVGAQSLDVQGLIRDSTLVSKSPLAGMSWLDVSFRNCTFIGVFKENEFGSLDGHSGSCESCDFSEAELDDCTFYGEFFDSHIFPLWPCLTISEPHLNFCEMMSAARGGAFEDEVGGIEFLDPSARLIAYNSSTLSLRAGVEVNDVHNFFKSFSFVKM